ncbi:hypothetical protein BU26DRAFT_512322 [Trematosphaeria pertusa]|uniref:Uncharacterized protein n=1 Tax=Trematosphaeria pertusa TaxID=390896 RepID=A0A6A6HQQ8_9PLEO|nr:uncharacterized protein BU26DRAFT_512322 [Trematosphaeria pertusa]KAF2240347.1 hypothetical protein BU26DRAFT_512322 [Trematosphaeria pertusa]
MSTVTEIEDESQDAPDSNVSPSRCPLREPEHIVEFKREHNRSFYLIHWRQSILTGEMLNTSTGEANLLTEAYMIRPHSTEEGYSSPGRIDETCIYDVLWYDTWLPSWRPCIITETFDRFPTGPVGSEFLEKGMVNRNIDWLLKSISFEVEYPSGKNVP